MFSFRVFYSVFLCCLEADGYVCADAALLQRELLGREVALAIAIVVVAAVVVVAIVVTLVVAAVEAWS
mgnify:CR=1 FL=1